MKKFLILSTILFSLLSSYSQPQMAENTGMIVGMVIDNNNQPIAYANLFLHKSTDSSVVDAIATDETGKFMFQNVKYNNYYLEIKLIGFQRKRISNIEVSEKKRFVRIGQITITEQEQQIGEVVVTATNTTVQYQLDKKVVNVGQDVAASGGNAADALRNVPSVNVDFDGNVTLRGSANFIVMIDGKPSLLDPNEALKQIPASNIEKIEIITNPSAKYDPDGDAGIINIITRQRPNEGLSGKIELGIDTYLAKRADLLLNYKKKKMTITTQLTFNENFRIGAGVQKRELYLPNYTQFLVNNQENKHIHSNQTAKLGFQYDFSKRDVLQLNISLAQRGFGDENHAKQNIYTSNNLFNFYLSNTSLSSVKGLNLTADVNYEHRFDDKGQKLKTYIQLSQWQPERYNIQTIDTTDNLWNVISLNPFKDRTIENINNKQLRFQIDYELPLTQKSKFETGLSLRMHDFNTKYQLENYINSQWIENPSYFNDMEMQLTIGSIYATYSNSLGKIFDYQIGVRGEYTYRNAIQKTLDTTYLYDKFVIYPTIHLSRQLPFEQQLQASYTLRVNRPDIRNLNPFPMRMNQFTYRVGNPALEPEFAHSFELNYSKQFGKSSISLETFYRQTNNKIDRRMILKDTIMYMFSDNLNKDFAYGGEIMANLMLLKFINLNLTASAFEYNLDGILEGVNVKKHQFTWNARFNIMTMLPSGTILQIGGFYNAPQITIDGKMNGMFVTFGGFRQSFFKRKLQVSVNVQDILRTSRFSGYSQTNQYYSNFEMRPKYYNIGITLTYRINNYKQERQRQRQENGEEMDFSGEGIY